MYTFMPPCFATPTVKGCCTLDYACVICSGCQLFPQVPSCPVTPVSPTVLASDDHTHHVCSSSSGWYLCYLRSTDSAVAPAAKVKVCFSFSFVQPSACLYAFGFCVAPLVQLSCGQRISLLAPELKGTWLVYSAACMLIEPPFRSNVGFSHHGK